MTHLLLNPDGDFDGAFFDVDPEIVSFEAPGIRHPDGLKYTRLWRLPLTPEMSCFFVKSARLSNAREAALHLFNMPPTNGSPSPRLAPHEATGNPNPRSDKIAMLYGGVGHRKVIDFAFKHRVVRHVVPVSFFPKVKTKGVPSLEYRESTYELQYFAWDNINPQVSSAEWLPIYLCREEPMNDVLKRVFLDYSEIHLRGRAESFVTLEMRHRLIY